MAARRPNDQHEGMRRKQGRNTVDPGLAALDLCAQAEHGEESLLVAVGCQVVEGAGSRVRFAHGAEVEFFHRPHPAKEAKRYQVRAARAFLIRLGYEP